MRPSTAGPISKQVKRTIIKSNSIQTLKTEEAKEDAKEDLDLKQAEQGPQEQHLISPYKDAEIKQELPSTEKKIL